MRKALWLSQIFWWILTACAPASTPMPATATASPAPTQRAPERVTFACRSCTEVPTMVKTIAQETRNRSLAGVFTRDLKGFMELQE